MCTQNQTLFLNWGQMSLILKNRAKTRIVSFEIQKIKPKPRPKESLTQRTRKKFPKCQNEDPRFFEKQRLGQNQFLPRFLFLVIIQKKTKPSLAICHRAKWTFFLKPTIFWLHWRSIVYIQQIQLFFSSKYFHLVPFFPQNKPLEICNPFFLVVKWFAP